MDAVARAMAAFKELEPADAAVADVLARGRARPRRRRRLALLAAVVVAGGVSAVPATRAGMNDVYGLLAPWVDGGGHAPGRPANADDGLPEFLPKTAGDSRVLAENAGVKLVVAREGDRTLTFLLGTSFASTEPVEEWTKRLAGESVLILGMASFPGGRPLDEAGRRPLLGIVGRTVERVELSYGSGAPTVQDDLDGGFVLLADAHRTPRELVAFDARGGVVGRLDARGYDLRVCTDVRGCPPGRYKP